MTVQPSQAWSSIYADPLEDMRRWVDEIHRASWNSSPSTDTPSQPTDPNDTTSPVNLNAGPAIPAPAVVEAPRIGRPYRGNRAKTKAARRARRFSR